MIYLGVDPGASGGMAEIHEDGTVARFKSTPKTEQAVLDWLRADRVDEMPEIGHILSPKKMDGILAFVEEIPTAIFGADKSSGAKLYGSYMALRMALTAVGIPYVLVKGADWQAGLGIPPRRKKTRNGKSAESRGDWKARLKRFAEGLFPEVRMTLATSDAILIAEYGRRKEAGLLTPRTKRKPKVRSKH